MKKIIFLAALSMLLVACGSSDKQAETKAATETVSTDVPTMGLDDLLLKADEYLDKDVKVMGYITHTCKHSGRRCFLVGESQDYSIRVEAKGKIGGFNRELMGTKVEILGKLHERRLSTAEIDAMEKNNEAKKLASDGSAEACDAETANIEKMRALMKKQGKDYYSIYFMDGEDYAEVK